MGRACGLWPTTILRPRTSLSAPGSTAAGPGLTCTARATKLSNTGVASPPDVDEFGCVVPLEVRAAIDPHGGRSSCSRRPHARDNRCGLGLPMLRSLPTGLDHQGGQRWQEPFCRPEWRLRARRRLFWRAWRRPRQRILRATTAMVEVYPTSWGRPNSTASAPALVGGDDGIWSHRPAASQMEEAGRRPAGRASWRSASRRQAMQPRCHPLVGLAPARGYVRALSDGCKTSSMSSPGCSPAAGVV